MGNRLQFAAVLGVKDEAALIAANVRHLRAIGVESIRVIDSGSTDGTLELLAGPLAGPDLRVAHHSDADPDAAAWSKTAAALARESGAEWVLFLDADEFWIPSGGSMHSVRGLDGLDVVQVERFNVPLDARGIRTEGGALPPDMRCELITRSLPDFRARMSEDPEIPWIRIVPMPKVLARASRIGEVSDGFHEIVPTPGPPLRRAIADDLVVAHVPFTTLPRFGRKVENIHRIFEVHDAYCGADIAWHWRRLLACVDDATLRAEFARQVFDDETLASLRADGFVTTADAWFRARAQRRAQSSAA